MIVPFTVHQTIDVTNPKQALEALGLKARLYAVLAEADRFASVAHAWKAGRALIEARDLCHSLGHGKWTQWLRDHWRGTDRLARYYVELGQGFEVPPKFPTLRAALTELAESRKEDPDKPETVSAFSEVPPDSDAIELDEEARAEVDKLVAKRSAASARADRKDAGSDEHYTPAPIVSVWRDTMGGIDLDPASSPIANERVKAAKIYTKEDDGLTKTWKGRLGMNPPYNGGADKLFVIKLVESFEAKLVTQACALLPSTRTEQEAYQRLLRVAAAVCWIEARVKHVRPDGTTGASAPMPSALFYLGDRSRRFVTLAEEKLGVCTWRGELT